MVITIENEGVVLDEFDRSITYDGPDDFVMTVLHGEIAELDDTKEKVLQDIHLLFEMLRKIRSQKP